MQACLQHNVPVHAFHIYFLHGSGAEPQPGWPWCWLHSAFAPPASYAAAAAAAFTLIVASRYSAWDYSRVQLSKGAAAKLEVPLGDVAVHYRGGAIIPWQPAGANALVTRDVRYSPVTLLVTLPSMTADARHMATVAAAAAAGTTKRAAEQTTGAGSLQPYANEEVCAAAYNAPANARKLVSCGLLYMDADTLEVSPNNTVQVGVGRHHYMAIVNG